MTDTHDLATRAETLPAAPDQLHPAVAQLLERDPTPEALREILALQREYEADCARKAYTAALVDLRAALPAFLHRDQQVRYKNVHYRHTSLAAAMDAVVPILGDHGFALTWAPATNDRQVTVTATLTHRGGHSESCSLSAPVDTSGSKSPAQGVASTTTLLQRYTALSLLGIATGDMTEPGPSDPDPDAIDTARNLRAVAALTERGMSRHDAEEMVGKPADKWTGADLDTLREWVWQQKGAEEGGEG